MWVSTDREIIYLDIEGKIRYSGHKDLTPMKVVLKEHTICLGYTDIDVKVLDKIHSEYHKAFPKEIVLQ